VRTLWWSSNFSEPMSGKSIGQRKQKRRSRAGYPCSYDLRHSKPSPHGSWITFMFGLHRLEFGPLHADICLRSLGLVAEGFTNGRQRKKVIEQIADKVNDLFENIANTASEAFDQPIEAAPVKPVRQSVPAYEFPVPDSSNQTVATSTRSSSAQWKWLRRFQRLPS
jgi:hypothetical protein